MDNDFRLWSGKLALREQSDSLSFLQCIRYYGNEAPEVRSRNHNYDKMYSVMYSETAFW